MSIDLTNRDALEALTIDKLRAAAKDASIEIPADTTGKAAIIDALMAASGADTNAGKATFIVNDVEVDPFGVPVKK